MDLRKAAKGKHCVICNTGYPDPTVVLCHLNIAGNFGMGFKSQDFPWGVWLCGSHHRWVDGPGRADWKIKFLALGRQMQAYLDAGVITMKALPLLLLMSPVFGHEVEPWPPKLEIPRVEYVEPRRVEPPRQEPRRRDPPIIIATPCDRQGREQCWVVVE